jgi:hypothetical protein
LTTTDIPQARSAKRTTFEEETLFLRSRVVALILIIAGALLLASNLGWIPQLRPLLQHWWPLILIAIGLVMLIRR